MTELSMADDCSSAEASVINEPQTQSGIMSSFDQLVARYVLDAGGGAEREPFAIQHRLARALDTIGWRAASDTPAEDIASDLALIIDGCVHGHRDLVTLRGDIAACLWQHADHLDGSSAARDDWEPAAARIIDLYAAEEEPPELR
jgi:hypothetical protein